MFSSVHQATKRVFDHQTKIVKLCRLSVAFYNWPFDSVLMLQMLPYGTSVALRYIVLSGLTFLFYLCANKNDSQFTETGTETELNAQEVNHEIIVKVRAHTS